MLVDRHVDMWLDDRDGVEAHEQYSIGAIVPSVVKSINTLEDQGKLYGPDFWQEAKMGNQKSIPIISPQLEGKM